MITHGFILLVLLYVICLLLQNIDRRNMLRYLELLILLYYSSFFNGFGICMN